MKIAFTAYVLSATPGIHWNGYAAAQGVMLRGYLTFTVGP